MAAKIDRRRKPTPKWEPPARPTDSTNVARRIGKALAMARMVKA